MKTFAKNFNYFISILELNFFMMPLNASFYSSSSHNNDDDNGPLIYGKNSNE
jgi:hypothetical protein